MNGILPSFQRRLATFAGEQRGSIPKQSVVTIGGILATTAVLAGLASAQVCKNQPTPENSKCKTCIDKTYGHQNQVSFAGGGRLEVSHSNTEAYHCSHQNCCPPSYK